MMGNFAKKIIIVMTGIIGMVRFLCSRYQILWGFLYASYHKPTERSLCTIKNQLFGGLMGPEGVQSSGCDVS